MGELFLNQVAMRGARHHDGTGKAIIARNAPNRLFEQGCAPDQGEKRLGLGFAADRPKPSAAASAQDNRVNGRRACHIGLGYSREVWPCQR